MNAVENFIIFKGHVYQSTTKKLTTVHKLSKIKNLRCLLNTPRILKLEKKNVRANNDLSVSKQHTSKMQFQFTNMLLGY